MDLEMVFRNFLNFINSDIYESFYLKCFYVPKYKFVVEIINIVGIVNCKTFILIHRVEFVD